VRDVKYSSSSSVQRAEWVTIIATPAQLFCAVDCSFVKNEIEFNKINLLLKAWK
jgi:hypothetical protein